MARIKVEDLPQDMKVSREDMQKVLGGRDMYPPATWETEHSFGGYYIAPQSIPWGDDVVRHLFTPEECKA